MATNEVCDHIEVTDVAVEPTCTTTGLTEGKHCSKCGAVIVAQEVIPAKGHTEEDGGYSSAGCVEDGRTGGVWCSACFNWLVDPEIVSAEGHSWSELYEKDGQLYKECYKCGTEVLYIEDDEAVDTESWTFDELENGTYSATYIGSKTITSVVIPKSYNHVAVTEISGFKKCNELKTVTLPDNIKTVGVSCFQNCTSLESVSIPDGLEHILSKAFMGCSNLKSIELPDGCGASVSCFEGCTSLTSFVIPDGWIQVPYRLLYGCTSLKSITIPSSVKRIGEMAFAECSSLESIVYNGTLDAFNKIKLEFMWNDGTGAYSMYYDDTAADVYKGDYQVVVGEQFIIETGITAEDVVTPNCVRYDGELDGGQKYFTAIATGEGTIRIVSGTGAQEKYSVRVICDIHTPEHIETIPPTCTEVGYSLYVCSVCGVELKSEFVAALGHDWGAAYTAGGVQYRECNRCGVVEKIGDSDTPDDPDDPDEPNPDTPNPNPGGDGDGDGDGDGNTGGGSGTGSGGGSGSGSIGVSPVRLDAMYQWDYGQKLVIDATGMSTVVEVHFAHTGMLEAIAYACAVHNNTLTVPIPNECLEQTSDIKVWVYEYDGDSARTTREYTIPITPRIRPPRNSDVPQSISDRYTEVITQMNSVVDGLRDGSTVVKRAESAAMADEAHVVKNAENATNATTATFATTAGKTQRDNEGTVIHTWYVKNRLSYATYEADTRIDGGLIEFRVTDYNGTVTSIIANVQSDCVSSVFGFGDGSVGRIARLKFDGDSTGKYIVDVNCLNDNGTWSELHSSKYTILYQYLSAISNKGEDVGPTGGIVKVGTTWNVDADVSEHTVTVTGGLSVYQDSEAWQIAAERVGVGTVKVTDEDGRVLSLTTYTIVEAS